MKIPKIQALYTFISRLSKREKIILYGAAFVLSLTMIDRLIINPISSKVKLLNSQIQEKETGIKRDLRILAQKDRILAEKAKYSTFVESLDTEEEEITSILKEIENLAGKSSVYLVDMKPAAIKGAGTSKKYSVNLNCEAQMEQLVDFIYNIESSGKLFVVAKCQITPKSKESSVAKCTMSITKIVIE